MADFAGVVRSPTISETSFNCPHCGALAKQYWFKLRAAAMSDDDHPSWPTHQHHEELFREIEDGEARESAMAFSERLLSRAPFVDGSNESKYSRPTYNLHLSSCYNCDEIAVWIGEGMVWPSRGAVARPNQDMPFAARADYEEASAIVDQSPRGAAALLRLAIQRICIELGGKGRNLNEDISGLVSRGLDKRVQQALDVVRVVGNNAVHPGEIDIKDDRATADQLFNLVNLIVDIMISQPKHVETMFAGLPPDALAAIERRDNKN